MDIFLFQIILLGFQAISAVVRGAAHTRLGTALAQLTLLVGIPCSKALSSFSSFLSCYQCL